MSARPRLMSQSSQDSEIHSNQDSPDSAIDNVAPLSKRHLAKIDPVKNTFSSPTDPSHVPNEQNSNSGLHLITALEIIAQQWYGRVPQFSETDSSHNVPAPEALIAAGADMGLDIRVVEDHLDRIENVDCPCLVVDRQGRSKILIERKNPRSYLCQTRNGPAILSLQDLKKDFSGVMFRLAPINDFNSEDVKSEDRPVGSILALIFSTMLRRKRRALLHMTVASGISNLLLIAVPMFSMAVFDRVLPHMAYETLWALTIGIVIALLADLGLRQVKLKIGDSIAADISQVVQVRLFKRLLQGHMNELPRTGGVMAQTVRDLEAYCHIVPLVFLSICVDLPFVIITTIILFGVAGSVAFVPLIGGLIIGGVYLAAHIIGHAKLAPYLSMMRAQSNTMIEAIDGIETVKTAGAESKLLNRWERLTDAAALSSHESRLSHGLAAQIAMTLTQLMTVGALVLGVYEISQNAMTVGALTAATMLIGRLVSPITQFVAQAQRLAQAKKMLEPIRSVLNTKVEQAGDRSSEALRPVMGEIDFINVSFSYPDTEALSLDNVTVSFKPGERVGIIGRVGSGKSTLLRLMARLQEPTGGVIRLDGSDIRQVSPRNVRNAIIYMKQDAGLFDDTLRANLLFGVDRPDPALFEQAASISGVSILANKNPEGYGMRVGPRGERLSGGERQAVGLARAIIKNPRMLLLDEPTASMDNTIERQIINGLKGWIGERGLIIATHRAAMLDLVDRVILMHDGKILADGPKTDVLRKLSAQGRD